MKPIAFIPARGGSKRIPMKNIQPLGGVPLIAWTIAVARSCGAFSRIVCSTDSFEIAAAAKIYGAEIPFMRPEAYADGSRTYEWLVHACGQLRYEGAFVILYPTNPFRKAQTICRAIERYTNALSDSLVSLRPAQEHPGKMWCFRPEGRFMVPLTGDTGAGLKDYNRPTQDLRPVLHSQAANIRISNTGTLERYRNETGKYIAGFLIDDEIEAMDINTPNDLLFAQWLVDTGRAKMEEGNA
jgi:N-acylneuraminate cytidylyltransferase